MKIRRRTSSSTSSTCGARSGRSSRCSSSCSRAIASCLRSRATRRRSPSTPRRLAVVMSQPPGLSGIPDCGHCSSAATRASWARSSATDTSRTMRVSPAISRADSIRQTASIARWVADGATASVLLGGLLAQPLVGLAQLGGELLAEVVGLEDRAQLDLHAAAERCALEPLDRLLARSALPDPVARHDLLGLGERTVDDGALVALESDLGAPGGRVQALARQHDAGLDELLVVPRHRLQELRGGHLARLGLGAAGDQNHETHCCLLVVVGVAFTRTSNEDGRNRHVPPHFPARTSRGPGSSPDLAPVPDRWVSGAVPVLCARIAG